VENLTLTYRSEKTQEKQPENFGGAEIWVEKTQRAFSQAFLSAVVVDSITT
jgi:hypothetical protein